MQYCENKHDSWPDIYSLIPNLEWPEQPHEGVIRTHQMIRLSRQHPFSPMAEYRVKGTKYLNLRSIPIYRLIAAKYLGRFLWQEEIVYHLEGESNNIENLEIAKTRKYYEQIMYRRRCLKMLAYYAGVNDDKYQLWQFKLQTIERTLTGCK